MNKELKIISKGPAAGQTTVFVGEKPIGLIQRIKFVAGVDNPLSEIEIVFPDLLSIPWYSNESLLNSLKEDLELLKKFPNVKIILEKLTFEDS